MARIAGVDSARPPGIGPSEWAPAIERAILHDGLHVVVQPIVDLNRLTIAGYEALARFDECPEISPDLVFAEAARLGCLGELEAAVLDTMLSLRRDLPPNTFLAVNVEPDSLGTPEVMEVFRLHGSLGGIVVEITEHRRIGDIEAVRRGLDEIRRLGALTALDDAGAGYSGLQQIVDLRPQILKVDRSLVAGIDEDETKAALLEMLGVFANRIDAWVLVEGVETEAEARRCRQLGVPLVQGWFFAHAGAPWPRIDPMAIEALNDGRWGSRPHGLARLLTIAPAVQRHDLRGPGTRGHRVVVVLEGRRPVGIAVPRVRPDGRLLTPLLVNVNSSPSELAHRVATHDGDERIPVVVIDDAGRYVGVVTVRRLLASLS